MKKLLFSLVAVAMVALVLSSCAATKRDCRGNKHVRLSNGIYL